MFDVEKAIKEWRLRVFEAGINNSRLVDELEGHLRDDLRQGAHEGLDSQRAFESAVEHLGDALTLRSEFDKVDPAGKTRGSLKHAFLRFAGITPQCSIPMNTNYPNIEPRWATYLRATIFVAPALISWGIFAEKIFPSLNQILNDPRVKISAPFSNLMHLNGAMMWAVDTYALPFLGAAVVGLLLLEWRSKNWTRYRRAACGAGVFALNCTALVWFFVIILIATVAAVSLHHPADQALAQVLRG